MTLKTVGAEVVERFGQDVLVRIRWRDSVQAGECLRIVRPVSKVERFLFTRNRLSPGVLRRISVLACLLIPVLILLNTLVSHVPGVPYIFSAGVTVVLLSAGLVSGSWFLFGAGMVDRLQDDPLRAMKAPAVPVPDWWIDRMEEVTPMAVRAFQSAFLAHEVDQERIRSGEMLQGQFVPSQPSYRSLGAGVAHVVEHRRRLGELLSRELLTEEHCREMLRVAEEPAVPAHVAGRTDAADVRAWVRGI